MIASVKPIQTVIIDPNRRAGGTIRAWLEAEHDFAVNGLFHGFEGAKEAAQAADLLILSATLDPDDSVHFCRQAIDGNHNLEIILVVDGDSRSQSERVQREVDCEFWMMDGGPDLITLARSLLPDQMMARQDQANRPDLAEQLNKMNDLVERMQSGIKQFDQSIHNINRVIHHETEDSEAQSAADQVELTDREEQVLQKVEQGMSNREIAEELSIEVGTVKNHVHNILMKYGVSSRHVAAHLYQQNQ